MKESALASNAPAAREALLETAKGYCAAIVAHDPARARLAPGFRGTENAVLVAPGEGSWRDIDEFSSAQMFVDAHSGQVVAAGAVRVQGALHPYVLRLKVVERQVSEAEFLRSSSTSGHFAAVEQLLKPDVLYDAPVPSERGCRTREELRSVADRYWVALNESDGSLAKFNIRCDRYANGKKITNSLELLLSPDAAVHTPASLITATRPARPEVLERRFPVLDVERGVAVSFAVVEFRQNAGRKDFGAFHICGIVKVVDDEFRNVDHIHEILPRGVSSGWQ